MIFEILILILLCIGSYQDIKTRNVDNKISFTVIAMCIPLVIFNFQSITLTHVGIAVVILVATIYRMYGPADMKVIIPLVFTLPKINMMVFFVVVSMVAGALMLKYKKEIPFFVAITAGYVVAIIV
jgi:Flp pilus assembly protein protease CpaA